MSALSLRELARTKACAVALIAPAEGVVLRASDLLLRTAGMWGALRRKIGHLGPATRVAVQASNRVDTLALLLALNESATPFVPLHPRLTDSEIAVLLGDAQPQVCLREADLCDLAAQAPSTQDLADFAALPAPQASRTLAILYTSGTSGVPKGAMLSASAFVASALASEQNLGWRGDDRWLLCLPLCHVGGLSIVTRCLLAQRPVILLPRADVSSILATIEDQHVTLLSVVATTLAGLLRDDNKGVLARLRAVLSGGAATPQPLYEQALAQRVPVLRTYGLTEACSQVTVGSYRRALQPQAGSGQPLAGVDLRIVPESAVDQVHDPSQTGSISADLWAALPSQPLGTPGRIVLRGPTLMQGYLNHAPLAGRPFDTGDLGFLQPDGSDRGALHVLSRRTDLIVTGGENVYPAEVEAALLACADVAAALVFGVDDPLWGAAVAAAVVPCRGVNSDGDEALLWQRVVNHLASRLAGFKRPRLGCLRTKLPELANGKPDRRGAARDLRAVLRPLPAPRID